MSHTTEVPELMPINSSEQVGKEGEAVVWPCMSESGLIVLKSVMVMIELSVKCKNQEGSK